MGQLIVWNRRSGRDRRTVENGLQNLSPDDDRRLYDRRLYGGNDYLLIIGQVGIDRFTLLVALPALAITLAALLYGAQALS